MHGVISGRFVQASATFSFTRRVFAYTRSVFGLKASPVAVLIGASLLFFALPSTAQAAVKYWVGSAGGNFSTAANWNTSAAACSGAGDASAAPGTSDVATFVSNCTNNATIDDNISVSGIDIQALYTGTITQAAAKTITVGTGHYNQAAGTFTGGDSAITFNFGASFTLSGGIFNATSGTLYNNGDFNFSGGTFNAGTGTVEVMGTSAPYWIFNPIELNNFTINKTNDGGSTFVGLSDGGGDSGTGESYSLTVNGTLTLGEGRMLVAGHHAAFSLNAKGPVVVLPAHDGGGGGTATPENSANDYNEDILFINGTSNQSFTIPAGAKMKSTTLNNSLTTIDFSGSGTVEFLRRLTVTAGTVDAAANASVGLNLYSGLTVNGGTFTGGASDVLVVGDVILSSGTLTAPSGTLSVKSISNLLGGIQGDGMTYYGWTHTAGGTFNNNGGTVAFTSDASATADETSATIDVNSAVSTSGTFNNLTVNITNSITDLNISSGDTLTVNGTFTWTDGAINTGTVDAKSHVVVGAGADGHSASTVSTLQLTGSGTQTCTLNGGGAVSHLTINNASATCTVQGSGTFTFEGNFTLTNGAYNGGSIDNTFASQRTITISGGTYTATSATLTLNTTTGTAFTHTAGGTFNHNDGTVRLIGIGVIFDVATTETFKNLTLSLTAGTTRNFTISSGDTLVVAGTLTLTDGRVMTGTLEAQGDVVMGSLYDQGTAAFSFTGSATNQTFTDNSAGSRPSGAWTINKPSGTVTLATNMVVNATSQDLTITSGTLDLAGFNLTVNDVFTLGASGTLKLQGLETVSAIDTITAGSTVIYNGSGNYTGLAAGNSYSNLTFNGSGGTWDTPTANVTVDNALTLTAGTLDLGGRSLAVTGAFTSSGTLRLNGSEASVTSPSNLTTTGTVAYDNTSTVTDFLLGDEYYNLTLGGSGSVQLGAALDVNNVLTVSSGATLDFNGSNLTLAGNFANSGTLSNTSPRTLTLNNTSGTQTIDTDSATFATLAVSGGGGTASLTSGMTVGSALTIASGDTLNVATGITLTSSGTITNSGNISETGTGNVADPASSLYIADSNFDEDAVISLGDEAIYLSMIDEDGNTNGGSADTLTVTVSCATDSQAVTVTETGNATELFRNSGLTTGAYDGSASNDDGTLECNDGVTITASYTDSKDATDTESDTATANTVPTAPSSFSGSADSATAITWTWTDNASNEDGFKLLDTSNTVIATIATPSSGTGGTVNYQESGRSASTSYTRKVVAYNDAGNSTASATATVTTDAASSVPTAPSSFAGTALSSTTIRWSWTDNSSDETSWVLQDEDGDTIALITTTTGSATGDTVTYEETGLTRNTSYTRKVAARNGDGTSAATGSASVTTLTSEPEEFSLSLPTAGALLATSLPTFSWTKAIDEDDGIDYYQLVIDDTITLQIPRDGASSSNPGSHTHYADGFIAQYFNENDGNENNDTIRVALRAGTTNLFPLSDGTHSWYVTARDTAGNTRTTASRTFIVDTAAPLVADVAFSVPVTYRNGTYTFSATTPTVTLTFTDSLQLAQAVVTLEEATTTLGVLTSYTARQTTTYALTGTSAVITFTPRAALTAGNNYRLRIMGRDSAGNERETQLLGYVLTSQEAAREAVRELDAETTPTDTIVQRLRDALPESPFSVPEFSAHALLRRQREGAAFQAFLTQLKQSWLAQLIVMNRYALLRPFLALQTLWERVMLAMALYADAFQAAAQQNIATLFGYTADRLAAGRGLLHEINTDAQNNLHETASRSLMQASNSLDQLATLDNALVAQPAERLAITLYQWADWAATVPRAGEGQREERARTGDTLTTVGTQLETAGTYTADVWTAGKDTRVREGLRNRQLLARGLERILTPIQRGSKYLATRALATYEIWIDTEPTKIANVRITTLTPTSAVIEWDTNHHTRTAAVNYGPSTNYGQKVTVDELTNRHRIEITNLAPATTYYFEIMNQNGDYVYDAYYALTTPQADTVLPGALTPQDARMLTTTEVRRAPEPNAPLLATLPAGTQLRALREQGAWISVLLPSGAEGWVQREQVELLPQAAGPSAERQHTSTGSE